MSYRNKTYVVFDADSDGWAYAYMKGWKSRDHIDFDFHDAHDLAPIASYSSEDTVKRRLRERFSSAKQVVVLVGEKTRNPYRFVRWELDVALRLDLPIVAANLNEKRRIDAERCPPNLRGEYVLHVAFKARILKYALDHFPSEYRRRNPDDATDRYYTDDLYRQLGLGG